MAVKEPVLSKEDRANVVWLKLSAFLEKRLADARISNDSTKHDEKATAGLRARIKELKFLLSLGTETPIVDDSDKFKD